MKVEIITHRLKLSAEASKRAYSRIHRSCARFAEHIQQVTVRVSDINGPRGGIDKRVVVQVALANGGGRLTAVSLHEQPGGAIASAMEAIRSSLRKRLGDRRGYREPVHDL